MPLGQRLEQDLDDARRSTAPSTRPAGSCAATAFVFLQHADSDARALVLELTAADRADRLAWP